MYENRWIGWLDMCTTHSNVCTRARTSISINFNFYYISIFQLIGLHEMIMNILSLNVMELFSFTLLILSQFSVVLSLHCLFFLQCDVRLLLLLLVLLFLPISHLHVLLLHNRKWFISFSIYTPFSENTLAEKFSSLTQMVKHVSKNNLEICSVVCELLC